jgi:hypothetical protein
MSTLLLGSKALAFSHGLPQPTPRDTRARVIESLGEGHELGEITYDAEPLLVSMLAEGNAEAAGRALLAIFEDYVQTIEARVDNPDTTRTADAVAAVWRSLA